MTLKERVNKAIQDARVARNIRKQEKHWKWVNMYNVEKVRYEGLRDVR